MPCHVSVSLFIDFEVGFSQEVHRLANIVAGVLSSLSKGNLTSTVEKEELALSEIPKDIYNHHHFCY